MTEPSQSWSERLRLGREDRRASALGRRRAYLFAAGIVVATSWFEPMLRGSVSVGALVTRGLLVATMGLAATRALKASTLELELSAIALACQAAITWGVLTVVTGGAASPMAGFWAAFPLITVALTPDVPLAGLAVALLTMLGVTLLNLTNDALPLVHRLVHVGLAAMGATIAAYGSVQISRWQRAERQALRANGALSAELARLQQASDHADRLATVGGLAASVAHEINNPLAFVGANLRFLRDELAAVPPERREELTSVIAECEQGLSRIRTISSDLRGFVRASDEHEATAPRQLLEEALRIVSVRSRTIAEVKLVCGELPDRIPLPSHRLVQLVVNLVVNACDAIESLERGSLGSVEVSLQLEGERLVLRVEDDGPGIAPEAAAHLFEPYFTTKPRGRGTGLGLPVCQRIAQDAGGLIRASPRPGGGTCFVVELPLPSPGTVGESGDDPPGPKAGSDPMGTR